MSNSESTQTWNEEDDDLIAQDNAAFSDALASLEEHLQDHDLNSDSEDEAQQEELMYQEGAAFNPELSEDGDPEAVSYAEYASEDSDEFAAHVSEEGVDVSLDAALDDVDADQRSVMELDDLGADDLDGAEEAIEDEAFEAEINETATDAEDLYEDDLAEQGVSDDHSQAAPAVSPLAAALGGSHGADDFDLATLTQLVDEIRQESQRVTEMKDAVAKALNLIQEMSESLKS